MNKADSFVTISYDLSFDFVKCVWMDNVIASPIAIVAGGTVGFTNFDICHSDFRFLGLVTRNKGCDQTIHLFNSISVFLHFTKLQFRTSQIESMI
ncbi:hypothetical protein BLNAU_13685 [Blattamonas nauphoetae]|uniref:Uncharacterized protein n=1 Tax=Blattamonas nauphoetae TaxID=2049346 RepID=A0ABQ9XJM4_9EUKA|nr:hypothetical protein BLNAU_13685 [Blattamonas nauphoetae]